MTPPVLNVLINPQQTVNRETFYKTTTSGTAKVYVFLLVLRVIDGHQKIKYAYIYIYHT